MIGVSILGGGTASAAQASVAGQEQDAQSASDTMTGEIVVTAQKRTERLRDVPAAITALSRETIETRGIRSLDDVGRQTPSLIMSQRQNRVPNVVMRGIGAYGFVEGVGFYVDDVQNFTDKVMQLSDVERVEILKGPQATLFGGSSLAGAVRYISKRPNFTSSAEFIGEVGERDYYKAYGNANLPLIDEKVAIRASGYYQHDDGFIYDTNLRRSSSEFREYGLRGQLLLKPSERSTWLFTGRYRDYDGAVNTYARVANVEPVVQTTSLTFMPNLQSKSYGLVSEFTYDFDNAQLLSLTSYSRQKIRVLVDVDYTAAPALRAESNSYPNTFLSQELRLTSSGEEKFKWIAGLYASRRKNGFSTFAPFIVTVGTARIDPFLDYEAKQTEFAGFLNGTYRLGDFSIGAGGRLMRTIYEEDSRIFQLRPNSGYQKVANTAFLPKLILSYKPEGIGLFYASVAKGYESGKVSSSSFPALPYAPETNWTYEIGYKSSLTSKLYVELTGFYINSRNRQTEIIFVPPGSAVFLKALANAGDARSYGTEATVSWQPVHGLSLDGALGLLDAKWTDATYQGRSLRGRQIPNASRVTANLSSTYTIGIGNALELQLHGNATYRGGFPWQLPYIDLTGAEIADNYSEGYWLANARISVGSKDEHWQFAVRVDNLLDQQFYTEFLTRSNQSAAGVCPALCHTAAAGTRRRFVATLTTRF